MSGSDAGLVAGLAAGIGGALVGVLGVAFATGSFEYLGGDHPSPVAPVVKEELERRLLALNSPDLPYQVRQAQETDLIMEWKIVDAKWYVLYAKEALSETYRAFILLDQSRRTARYCEELGRVSWSAGAGGNLVPSVSYQRSFFRGRILFQKEFGVRYGIKDDFTIGKVYQYYFDVNKVRDPVRQTVKDTGWEFVQVVRKGHATYPRA